MAGVAGGQRGWVNLACDLEQAGDHEGAQALIRANTTPATPSEKRHLKELMRRFSSPEMVAALEEVSEITSRLRAARQFTRDAVVRRAWETVGGMLAGDALHIYKYLPKVVKRGRRPGSQRRAILLTSMQELTSGPNAMLRTTAAREVLEQAGVSGNLKGKVDSLVRSFNRANKSP